ncbi:hypothetical protein C0Z17_04090 [Trinickia caryophylli]|nr:hypothetical protein C0Z17_04090 [Trinickia caryophylli]
MRARLAIQYREGVQRLPLIRLDRQGFVVALTDDAGLPPIGLPRSARILAADVPLCELRLVARSLARDGDRALAMTLQPSRADDDTLFWQSLHSYVAAQAPLPDLPRQAVALQGSSARHAAHVNGVAATPDLQNGQSKALFTLPSHADAQFFAEWLEYHFAEIGARARSMSALAELTAMDRRRAGSEVAVVFHYRPDMSDARRCTEALCAWAVSEAATLFGLAVRCEITGTQRPTRQQSDTEIRLPFAS